MLEFVGNRESWQSLRTPRSSRCDNCAARNRRPRHTRYARSAQLPGISDQPPRSPRARGRARAALHPASQLSGTVELAACATASKYSTAAGVSPATATSSRGSGRSRAAPPRRSHHPPLDCGHAGAQRSTRHGRFPRGAACNRPRGECPGRGSPIEASGTLSVGSSAGGLGVAVVEPYADGRVGTTVLVPREVHSSRAPRVIERPGLRPRGGPR